MKPVIVEAKWVAAGVGLPPMFISDEAGVEHDWQLGDEPFELDLTDAQTAFGVAAQLDAWICAKPGYKQKSRHLGRLAKFYVAGAWAPGARGFLNAMAGRVTEIGKVGDPMAEMVEITGDTQDFRFLTLGGDYDHATRIFPNGNVVCVSCHGDWAGQLVWNRGRGWEIEFTGNTMPVLVELYFDHEKAWKTAKAKRERAKKLMKQAEEIDRLVARSVGEKEE